MTVYIIFNEAGIIESVWSTKALAKAAINYYKIKDKTSVFRIISRPINELLQEKSV